MKKIITLFVVLNLLIQWKSSAQMYAKGETFPDITLTDINGKSYNLYEYMEKGYAIVIKMGLTTCANCWQLKKSGLLNHIYDQYGPEGTKKKGKILPIFVECNVQNTQDQLYGKGSGTLGDWVTGAKYPIVDLKDNEELGLFFKSLSGFSTPAFYLICSNKKIFESFQGMANVTGIQNEFIANLDDCGETTPVEHFSLNHSLKVYPSPGVHQINVELELDDALLHRVSLINIEGRSVITHQEVNSNKITLDVAGISSGVYMLNITLNDGKKFYKRVLIAE